MKLTTLCLSAFLLCAPAFASTERPNVIIILTDDQGYADVGFNGCADIPTPHIDRIAHEGVRFTSGYVTFSVCSPSRAGMLTGRYQGRFGFRGNPSLNPADPKAGLPLEEETMANILKKVGYRTGIVGKWHLGTHKTLRPNKRGFDEFYGFESGGHNYMPEDLIYQDIESVDTNGGWYKTKILRDETPVEIDEYLTDEFSHEAVDFIERNAAKPFFLYLSYNAPHSPLQATQKYLDRFPHISDTKRKTYAAMVSAVDDGVGRVLAKLDELDLAENTLVFFLSDNGGPDSNGSSNTPLRGEKGTVYEGGVRVPFALRWPGRIQGGVDYDHPVSSMDILGTMAGLTGVEIAADRPLDGVNLLPYLSGARSDAPHAFLFWQMFSQNNRAVRSGDAKLVTDGKAVTAALYRIANDISESDDLSPTEPELTETLQAKLDEWTTQLKPPAFKGRTSWNPGKGKAED